MMTPAQTKLVQDSFRKVVPIAGQAAEMFYSRLFEIAPETRTLFKRDLGGQYDKFIQMLLWVVANLHKWKRSCRQWRNLAGASRLRIETRTT